jgi:hypothetical protein
LTSSSSLRSTLSTCCCPITLSSTSECCACAQLDLRGIYLCCVLLGIVGVTSSRSGWSIRDHAPGVRLQALVYFPSNNLCCSPLSYQFLALLIQLQLSEMVLLMLLLVEKVATCGLLGPKSIGGHSLMMLMLISARKLLIRKYGCRCCFPLLVRLDDFVRSRWTC